MASIYIKQGKYKKALDVMDKMKETNSKKNRYFSDQERFLKMLVMAKSKSE
jgi:pentatricopeptide repeat protein